LAFHKKPNKYFPVGEKGDILNMDILRLLEVKSIYMPTQQDGRLFLKRMVIKIVELQQKLNCIILEIA